MAKKGIVLAGGSFVATNYYWDGRLANRTGAHHTHIPLFLSRPPRRPTAALAR